MPTRMREDSALIGISSASECYAVGACRGGELIAEVDERAADREFVADLRRGGVSRVPAG